MRGYLKVVYNNFELLNDLAYSDEKPNWPCQSREKLECATPSGSVGKHEVEHVDTGAWKSIHNFGGISLVEEDIRLLA